MTGSWGDSPVPPLIATNSKNSSHTSLIFHTSMSSFDTRFQAHKVRGTNSYHIGHGQNDIRQLKAAATIINEGDEGSNNQNNIIVGDHNWNYAIMQGVQGGSGGTDDGGTDDGGGTTLTCDWCADYCCDGGQIDVSAVLFVR